jgi:DNA processing protein
LGINYSKNLILKMEIKIEDKRYPKLLRKISDSPKLLFYKGDFNSNIFDKTLAVVGSRRMTTYGKRVTEELITSVACYGITIVSGFMYGIDATAHKAALDAKGKTIAVMASGIDNVYPIYQKKLYQEIKEKGLIISEYFKKNSSEKWIYPRRNRIVAGISMAVLVVEAEEKSGSLITADFALKYKRKLFAVPGSIFSPTSKGTNSLIKNGLAEPVLSPKDILSFYKIDKAEDNDNSFLNFNIKESEIISILKRESVDLESIQERMKIPISELNIIISGLEIKGVIKKQGIKYYIK